MIKSLVLVFLIFTLIGCGDGDQTSKQIIGESIENNNTNGDVLDDILNNI